MLTLSLFGGVSGLILLVFALFFFKAIKLAQYLIVLIIGILAVIFLWESITGLLLYISSDLIETVVKYWGASLLIGCLSVAGVIWWRSK